MTTLQALWRSLNHSQRSVDLIVRNTSDLARRLYALEETPLAERSAPEFRDKIEGIILEAVRAYAGEGGRYLGDGERAALVTYIVESLDVRGQTLLQWIEEHNVSTSHEVIATYPNGFCAVRATVTVDGHTAEFPSPVIVTGEADTYRIVYRIASSAHEIEEQFDVVPSPREARNAKALRALLGDKEYLYLLFNVEP